MADLASTSYRLDADNPWPGLAWFDESSEQFFNGRTREIGELKRLVMDAPLTVLFGRSGLGKTSLLKAGLFPALRRANYLPVYLRLRYTDASEPGATALIEQLYTALRDACQSEMAGADAPERKPEDSLWEYLHRADTKIWSRQNQRLTPVFVLDQFEEVFTLGVAAPLAVQRLREDLADLAENRIPVTTERRMAASPETADAFSLRSQPYRVLLSFREDFATQFERWRELPSLMRNRLQLMPMNGRQALEAVRGAAPDSGRRSDGQLDRSLRGVGAADESAGRHGDRLARQPDGGARAPQPRLSRPQHRTEGAARQGRSESHRRRAPLAARHRRRRPALQRQHERPARTGGSLHRERADHRERVPQPVCPGRCAARAVYVDAGGAAGARRSSSASLRAVARCHACRADSRSARADCRQASRRAASRRRHPKARRRAAPSGRRAAYSGSGPSGSTSIAHRRHRRHNRRRGGARRRRPRTLRDPQGQGGQRGAGAGDTRGADRQVARAGVSRDDPAGYRARARRAARDDGEQLRADTPGRIGAAAGALPVARPRQRSGASDAIVRTHAASARCRER
ncbi:MAG: hypothetical protein QM736_02750 [Vicinamibacterales bacterium]